MGEYEIYLPRYCTDIDFALGGHEATVGKFVVRQMDAYICALIADGGFALERNSQSRPVGTYSGRY